MIKQQNRSSSGEEFVIDVDAVAGWIADTQRKSGEIPWHRQEKADPWDHVEAAMGLTVGGYFQEAKRAFEWLGAIQLEDGSWYSAYRDGVPEDRTRQSHMAAYISVGLFHYGLVTGDFLFIKNMWETLDRALGFAVSLQAETGEIWWAVSPEGNVDQMALLTGSSSIYMSLKCGLALAEQLGYSRPDWKTALDKLGYAVGHCPCLFNMTKSRYSMDWFYPVLSGAMTGEQARRRIDKYWKKFVIEEKGVRCVSDRPWVTMAETSEFCLALAAMNRRSAARIVFDWICDRTYDDGAYWCGFTCPDMTIWPEDRLTWTNGVVLMAADAVYDLTPGSGLFSHRFWKHFMEKF